MLVSCECWCLVGYGFEGRRRGSAGGPLLNSAYSDGSMGALVTNAVQQRLGCGMGFYCREGLK